MPTQLFRQGLLWKTLDTVSHKLFLTLWAVQVIITIYNLIHIWFWVSIRKWRPSSKLKSLKKKNSTNINACRSFFASQCWYKFKTLPGKLNRVYKKSKPQFNFPQLKFDFYKTSSNRSALHNFVVKNVTKFGEGTARRLMLPATGKGNLDRRPFCTPWGARDQMSSSLILQRIIF